MQLYKTADVIKICNIGSSCLKEYVRLKYVLPEHIDFEPGHSYNRYTFNDLVTLQILKRLIASKINRSVINRLHPFIKSGIKSVYLNSGSDLNDKELSIFIDICSVREQLNKKLETMGLH